MATPTSAQKPIEKECEDPDVDLDSEVNLLVDRVFGEGKVPPTMLVDLYGSVCRVLLERQDTSGGLSLDQYGCVGYEYHEKVFPKRKEDDDYFWCSFLHERCTKIKWRLINGYEPKWLMEHYASVKAYMEDYDNGVGPGCSGCEDCD
jgi:hypothetical protein